MTRMQPALPTALQTQCIPSNAFAMHGRTDGRTNARSFLPLDVKLNFSNAHESTIQK